MRHASNFTSLCKRFLSDKRGNFAMLTAFVLPVAIGAVGVAIDYGRLEASRAELQDAIDASALAASSAMAAGNKDDTNIEAYIKQFMTAQLQGSLSPEKLSEVIGSLTYKATPASAGGGVKTYDVHVATSYNVNLTALSLLTGKTSSPVGAAAAAQSRTETIPALSMFVVLDRSGSMSFVTDSVKSEDYACQNYTIENWYKYPNLDWEAPCYVNKMEALKSAANALYDELDALENIDPDHNSVRVGSVSFTHEMQTDQQLRWGTKKVRQYVGKLPGYPTGGTDMSDAMEKAFERLEQKQETTQHNNKGNSTFQKYIILMSDGENTGYSASWNAALDAETLATCNAARAADVTIYTVAFMAPANGRNMLKNCAGDASNYFEASDMDSLVQAFSDIGKKVTEQVTRMTQ